MSIDGRRNQFEGELAALQSRREIELLSASSVSSLLGEIAGVAGQFGVPGVGLFAKALKSGQTPIEKVVEQLESGAYVEISRVWKHLEGQDAQLKEFGERLESREAHSAYVAAVLHGLRTSDPRKQSRIGALAISCIYTNDMEPESLDDMMRAAVELKDADLHLLGKMCGFLGPVLRDPNLDPIRNWLDGQNRGWDKLINSGALDQSKHLEYRSSFGRLESHGLIQKYRDDGSAPVGHERYALLVEGLEFYERLQEIGATK